MELKKIKSKDLYLVIGSILLLCSSCYLIFNYTKDNNKKIIEEELIETFLEEETDNIPEETINSKSNEENNGNKVNYTMIIEIPDIGLKRGIYGIKHEFNTVSQNIKILDKSDYPDIVNGNVMLAAHNGNSKVSYFNKLDKLNESSVIYIYYNGLRYEYKFSNNYEIDKNGSAVIKRKNDLSTLTMITCKKNSKDKQIVYISYLINKTEY